MSTIYLAHHGVDNQKWGVRNGPPYPLTPDAKRKAGYISRKRAERKAKKEAKKNPEPIETEEEKKLRLLTKAPAEEVYKNRHLLTYDELKTAYLRLTMEENVKKLVPAKVNAGKKFVENASSTLDNASKLIDNGSKTWNSVAKVLNSTMEFDEPLPLIKNEFTKKPGDKK